MQIFIFMGKKNSMFLQLCAFYGKLKSYLLMAINLSFKQEKYAAPNNKRIGCTKNKKQSISLLWDPLIAQTYFKDLIVQQVGIYAPHIFIY